MNSARKVIEATGVGKRYLIGRRNTAVEARSLVHSARRNLRNVLTRTSDLLHGRPIIMGDEVEEFWALKDVAFDVREGEAVGLIGRNGAGKSTLLKVLSRITDPTEGSIRIQGRVASLLEVGTGFHPELSGRDNVFLNGAILGMSRAEIRGHFDSIVEFAGVERYIDTPVKRYSSGMYVRLAFAIAAHLEPDILIVDEVLAVGDMEFQKRCLGKMDQATNSGRTIVFVSHQMPMIASLCSRCLLMQAGNVVADGPTSEIIHQYQSGTEANAFQIEFQENTEPGNADASLVSAWVESSGSRKFEFDMNENVRIGIEFRIKRSMRSSPFPNIHVMDSAGNCVFLSAPVDWKQEACSPGRYIANCDIPARLLNDGMYSVIVGLYHFRDGLEVAFFEKGALSFNIVDSFESSELRTALKWGGKIPGVVRPELDWSVEPVQ